MSRRGGLTAPVLLIAIGVIFLLINTGAISAAALQRLGDLWPLLLVILGLQLVFNHSLPRRQSQLAGLVAAIVIVLAAIGFAILNPVSPGASQVQEASEPVGALTAATLDLSYSGATIEVGSGAVNDQLFNARVEFPSGGQPPDITLDREAATLDVSGGDSGFHLFQAGGPRHITLNLSTRIPWTIRVSGGAASMNLQLAELPLLRLEISGGASRLGLSLPHPKGELPVSLSGGTSALSVRAPAGTEWRLSIDGGVSSLDVDGVHLAGSANLRRQSRGYTTASDRLTIDITGGVSQVNLRTG